MNEGVSSSNSGLLLGSPVLLANASRTQACGMCRPHRGKQRVFYLERAFVPCVALVLSNLVLYRDEVFLLASTVVTQLTFCLACCVVLLQLVSTVAS